MLLLLACVQTPPADSDPLDCSTAPGDEEGNPLELDGEPTCGAELFADLCAVCHGDDGLGSDSGPDLSQHVSSHTDLELLLVLSAGTGDMDAVQADAQERAHLLAWLRAEFGDYDGQGH